MENGNGNRADGGYDMLCGNAQTRAGYAAVYCSEDYKVSCDCKQ